MENDGYSSKTLYVTKFEDGYYAKKQPHYEWSFTNDLTEANTYITEEGACDRVKRGNGCGNYKKGIVLRIQKDVTIDIDTYYDDGTERFERVWELLLADLPSFKNIDMKFYCYDKDKVLCFYPEKGKSYNNSFTFPKKLLDYTDEKILEYSTTQKQRREKMECSKYFTGHSDYLK